MPQDFWERCVKVQVKFMKPEKYTAKNFVYLLCTHIWYDTKEHTYVTTQTLSTELTSFDGFDLFTITA